MKKRIKDLTLEESNKICDKYKDCSVCVLGSLDLYRIDCKWLSLDGYGEQEIEVEENEKEN